MARWFDRTDSPLLASLFDEAQLRFVDIGARGEAFRELIPLAPLADYYAVEPDVSEADRLEGDLRRRADWRGLTIIREAIASRPGEAPLYVTSAPGMSSLLAPNAAVAQRYCLGSKFAVETVVTVPTLSLDEAAARYGCADATFLKLDTQGAELDILQSGPAFIQAPLGVFAEANFHPFYEGQPLFADVDTFLRQQGFALFSLSRTLLRRAGYREARYSRRVVAWAHCLYLREPETLLSTSGDTLRQRLFRLLALTLAFRFYDVAFEIVELAGSTSLLEPDDLARLRKEVDAVCRRGARHVARQMSSQDDTINLRAGSFRDPRHIE